MVSEEEMISLIQEWMSQALGIEDLAKIYAITLEKKSLNLPAI